MTTVLVVDDSAVDQKLAGGILAKDSSIEVHLASDGREALTQLDDGQTDLVVTDMQMPQMDGLELVDAMAKDFPFIPVVLITSKGSESIAADALARGASSYVPKQNMASDLLPVVRQVLETNRRGQSRLFKHAIRSTTEFEIPNDLAAIEDLLDVLKDLMIAVKLGPGAEIHRVQLAIEESLLNAYYHGNLEVGANVTNRTRQAYRELAEARASQEPYCNRKIYVIAELADSYAKIVVRDDGRGFEPFLLPPPDRVEDLTNQVGRGLVLMRTFMDLVIYNDLGSEVTLIKGSLEVEDE